MDCRNVPSWKRRLVASKLQHHVTTGEDTSSVCHGHYCCNIYCTDFETSSSCCVNIPKCGLARLFGRDAHVQSRHHLTITRLGSSLALISSLVINTLIIVRFTI